MRLVLGASLALALLAGPVAAQQLGAATKSPPPAGVQPGQGAANPKGHYAELDKLPDLIVPFKRDAYLKILEAFRDIPAKLRGK